MNSEELKVKKKVRNEGRPGYQKTKVGWIPEEWECVRFGDVVRIGNGQVSPQKHPYINYLHIGPENIVSGTGQLVGLKTPAELGLISGKYLFDNEAIVYSKIRPNLNKICIPGLLVSAAQMRILSGERIK